MKTKIIISIAILLIASGCGQTTKKPAETADNNAVIEQAENTPVVDEETTEKLTEIEVIRYLETFKELLLNNKIEELADLMHFPIEGDYAWEDDNSEIHVKPYRTKRDFIENYSKVFGEDLKSLLRKVDFKKALKEDYTVTIKREPNIELTFRVSIDEERELNFVEGYNEIDLVESATVYRARKIDGKIKLVEIYFAG